MHIAVTLNDEEHPLLFFIQVRYLMDQEQA